MKNSEFIIDKVPITKEEIRAISISKLDLFNAKRFLDIGSGTGSITVEAGYKFKDLEIVSIEKNEKAYELTGKNIEKFGLKNVTRVLGDAPESLIGKRDFDAIFIGGSGSNLYDILKYSFDSLLEGGRLVANFILLENFYECLGFMEELGFKNIEVSQVGVSNFEKLGKGRYFKPINPVFIVYGEK